MSSFSIPADYAERVYAGVLGKIIGVYLGRPFEGWSYERILAELGEITYYVHEKRGVPLVVTDDDISGTFTFLRALADYGYSHDLTAAQIGQTWLNYLIEERTILWWGGLGNSTEHTAYLRLKHGIKAPASGSIALNSKVVAEQIGAQIFIDGWGMVSPGNPELAATFAGRAGSVSHDGEAVYAAQVIAAMEAQAFVERDLNKLLDIGVSFIPKDSIVYRLIQDIREWYIEDGDWRKTRDRIVDRYGYNTYGGNCHVVPNHALIILALLYGEDNFQKSLSIVNTCGWDTDCNSGNVGCLLGIKNGLQGLEGGPDWRGPVADRLYLPTADGGRAITDALTETYHIIEAGHALAGVPFVAPKQGARFHFSLPGSLQSFSLDANAETSTARLENAAHGAEHSLAIRYEHLIPGQYLRTSTPTFIPPDTGNLRSYMLLASPTLYAGQTVQAHLSADTANASPVTARLFVTLYN
ncbi:MAG TPA: ADP-ribosylglycohydrolase family protein, partial [Ktedonobacteraceae bacterium]